MLISAAMQADGVSSPVRIRNMSIEGALIETSVGPPVGAPIALKRGSLQVGGVVVWESGKSCGVRFTSRVVVRDWMAPPANAGQSRVDAIVAQVTTGARLGEISAHAPQLAHVCPERSDRLAQASQLITELAEALVEDPAVVARHGAKLQNLDVVLQILATIRRSDQPVRSSP